MNIYLNALMKTPLIQALSENSRNEIINLLDDQNRVELEAFITSKIGDANKDALSAQLIEQFNGKKAYNFMSVIKEMMKVHRRRKLHDLFFEDPNSLRGKVLRIPGDTLMEYDVLQIKEEWNDHFDYYGGGWGLFLQDDAKITFHHRARNIFKTTLDFFQTRAPFEFIQDYINDPIKPSIVLKIVGRDMGILDSDVPYYFWYTNQKKLGTYINGARTHVYNFILQRMFNPLNPSSQKSFNLEVTCDSEQSIIALRILNDHGRDIGFTQQRFALLTFKVKMTRQLTAAEWQEIIVREKVLSGDELKLRKLEKIDKLQDDVVYALLKETHHALLNQIIGDLLRNKPHEYLSVLQRFKDANYPQGHLMLVVLSKLKQIKFLVDSLQEDLNQRPVIEKILLNLVFTSNYLRWMARGDSLSVLKAMELFNQFTDELDKLSEKQLILFLGATGAGKSTSINFFLDHPIQRKRVLGEEVLYLNEEGMDPHTLKNIAKIGQSIGTSETASTKGYPVPAALKEELLADGVKEIERCLLVDSPGFCDTRGINYQILSMLSIDQTIRRSEKIRAAVLVVPYETLRADRGSRFVELLKSFEDMFPQAFEVGSRDSESLYMLITKCKDPSEMEEHFDGFIQTLLTEDLEQLKKQKEAGSRLDARDTQRRINFWNVLLHLNLHNRIVYLDIENGIQRSEVFKRFLKSPGIAKDEKHVRNIFEKEDLKKKLADYINLSAHTNLSIMRSFLELIPQEIRNTELEIENKSADIERVKIEINEHQVEMTRLEDKIQTSQDEVTRLSNPDLDLNDPEIASQIKAKIQELQADQFTETERDLARMNDDIFRMNERVQSIIDEVNHKEQFVSQLRTDQASLSQQIKILQTGTTEKKIFQRVRRDTVRFGTAKPGAWDRAYEEVRHLRDDEWEEGSLKTVNTLDHRGSVFCFAEISEDYYLVPADDEQRRALLEVKKGGHYRAIITGENFKLVRAKAKDRKNIIYEFQLTYNGKVRPYFDIKHVIPNCDLNYSTVQNLQAEKDAKNTLILRYEKECLDLNREKSTLQENIDALKRLASDKKQNLDTIRTQAAVQNILESLASNIASSRESIAARSRSMANNERMMATRSDEMKLCCVQLDYWIVKRASFALMIIDQRSVMESLYQFCGLMLSSESRKDAVLPSGLLQQCRIYREFYDRNSHRLWEECELLLNEGAALPAMAGETLFEYFLGDAPHWSSFEERLPIPDMTVVDDPDPEKFLAADEAGEAKDAALDDFISRLKNEISKFLMRDNVREPIDTLTSLQRVAAEYAFEVRDVAGDGNCFFHAVADQLQCRGIDPEITHDALRERAAAFMVEQQDQFRPFIEALNRSGVEGYLREAFENGEWTDEPMILALAKSMGLTFVIIRYDGAAPHIIHEEVQGLPVLYLGYLGAHYVSLRGQPNAAADALLLSEKPMSPARRQTGRLDSSPSLNRVWRGRYTPDTESPVYRPVRPKTDGASIGFIAEKDKTKTNSTAQVRLWMAKLGWPEEFLPNEEAFKELTKRTQVHQKSVRVAVHEKIAADVYFVLGFGDYRVPKHRLAKLSISNDFTNGNLLVEPLLQEMNHGKEVAAQVTHSVFLMSRFEEGYRDFSELKDCIGKDGVELCGFMDAMINHDFLPEEAMVEGERIPIVGVMEILAASRLLGDTDVLGGSGKNAGFIIQRDSSGVPLEILAVKIDAGASFNFNGGDNQLARSFSPVYKTNILIDKKDIQFGNMQPAVVRWEALSQRQREAFMSTLEKGLDYLQDRAKLMRIVHRDGQFDAAFAAGASPFSVDKVAPFLDAWLDYLLIQKRADVYGDLIEPRQPVEGGAPAMNP